MKQDHTPLYDALAEYRERRPLSFHVPGHKNGSVFPVKGHELFRPLLSVDLTELAGLDDLHAPTGVIYEAQQLLSSFYNTDQSRFLVGGSTVGNLAMIQAVCQPGDLVLVQRNCHKSIVNGLKLANARPVFLRPEVDPASGLPTVPSFETVKEALDQFPGAKALILTNPNYYGMSVNLRLLIDHVHQHGIPVLVDEAHGAHFVLGSSFPESSLRAGADVVVQSAHKALPAMTMGAFLHIKSPRIHSEALDEALGMLQSSSPSYPIMASLDLARSYMARLTENDLAGIQRDSERIREKLSGFPQFTVVPERSSAYTALDPLKITLQMCCDLSGFEFAHRLEREGIVPELADPDHVLLILPLARFEEDDRLIEAIKRALAGVQPKEPETVRAYPEIPRLSRPFKAAEKGEGRRIALIKAEGKIAMEEITPYPPGVPVVISGERITASQIEAIRHWDETGGRFQAGKDTIAEGILVIPD